MQAAFDSSPARALFLTAPAMKGMAAALAQGCGRVWADSPLRPRAAVGAVGDFILCVGTPGPSAGHLLRQALHSGNRPWRILAEGDWRGKLRRLTAFRTAERYAFDCERQPEDAGLMRWLRTAPADVTTVMIDAARYADCQAQEWSRDLVAGYADAADYEARGLGVLVLLRGEPVAGASSCFSWPGGFETEAATRPDMRRRGYGLLAGASLILAGHQRGLKVSWDADNAASAALAEKLGYRPLGSYTVCRLLGEEA